MSAIMPCSCGSRCLRQRQGTSRSEPPPMARLHRQDLRPEKGELSLSLPVGTATRISSSTSGAARFRGLLPAWPVRAWPATSSNRDPASAERSASPMSFRSTTARSTMPRRKVLPPQRRLSDRQLSADAATRSGCPACWRRRRIAASKSMRCPARFQEAATPVGGLGAKQPFGDSRRSARRDAAQSDAVRVSDPRPEGAASSAGWRRTRRARRDALAYTAGAIVARARLALTAAAIRAAGSEAGWAFQLQDPRTIMLLLLLAVAITLNLLGLFELPVAGRRYRFRKLRHGALAAFVATPCAGPFLGAALGAALLLPLYGSIFMFAALGLGLAIPFLLVAFVPRSAAGCRGPVHGWRGFQRFLAIPMAATAARCLWLLCVDGRAARLGIGVLDGRLLLCLLVGAGLRATQRKARAMSRRWSPSCSRWRILCGHLGKLTRKHSGDRRRAAWSEAAGGRDLRAATKAGVRLFHRRLVPDLQGQ